MKNIITDVSSGHIDLTICTGQESAHRILADYLNKLANNLDILDATMSVSDLAQMGFHQHLSYFVHPGLVPTGLSGKELKAYLYAVVKVAPVEAMARRGSIEDNPQNFISFIYANDKYLKLKGIDCKQFKSSLRTFVPSYETNKTSGKRICRLQGSRTGSKLRSKNPYVRCKVAKKQVNRDHLNNLYLRVLQWGATNCANELLCSVDGTSLIRRRSCPYLNKLVEKNCYEIHHCLHSPSSGSKNKSTTSNGNKKEPSKLLQNPFTSFTVTEHLEFLGCILLSSDEHDITHKVTKYGGDIKNWFHWHSTGDAKYLPYHWKSEKNYNETVTWIAANSYRVLASDFPSYWEFIQINSMSMDEHHTITKSLKKDEKTINKFHELFNVV